MRLPLHLALPTAAMTVAAIGLADSALTFRVPTESDTTPAWPGATALVVAIVGALLGVANPASLRRKS